MVRSFDDFKKALRLEKEAGFIDVHSTVCNCGKCPPQGTLIRKKIAIAKRHAPAWLRELQTKIPKEHVDPERLVAWPMNFVSAEGA